MRPAMFSMVFVDGWHDLVDDYLWGKFPALPKHERDEILMDLRDIIDPIVNAAIDEGNDCEYNNGYREGKSNAEEEAEDRISELSREIDDLRNQVDRLENKLNDAYDRLN